MTIKTGKTVNYIGVLGSNGRGSVLRLAESATLKDAKEEAAELERSLKTRFEREP